jgi:hydroxymethylpyrimidine/phosphomethylpyrimidine kinase
MTRIPNVLSIAGSDPSGGAGIQADLKTFSALGAYGCAALTALTAQNTTGVTGVHVVPPDFVRAQVETLVADVRLDAVKIGMLATAPVVEAVTRLVDETLECPVILDPVMVSTSGSRLLDDDAVAAMRALVPVADAITPNIHEAAVLLGGEPADSIDAMRRQAEALRDRGAQRVLLKGGHGSGREAVDIWLDEDGEAVLRALRVDTRNTHGTGCSLSSAIAALMPQRGFWVAAVTESKEWLTAAIAASGRLDVGHGPGPVHHLHAMWGER